MIPPGGRARYSFTPRPAGFRWYHTHTFAGRDLHKGQYTGEHGFLLIEPRDNPARYDQEFFLALHDWDGRLLASGDGAMDPVYQVSRPLVLGYQPCPGAHLARPRCKQGHRLCARRQAELRL